MKESKKLLFLCSYSAPYGGNFIPSLIELEERLKTHDIDCVYAFPYEAKERSWLLQLKNGPRNAVFLNFSLSRLAFAKELAKLVDQQKISFVYSHFTSMLPIEIFAFMHRDVQVYIHIHSDFSAGQNTFAKRLQNFLLFKLFSGQVHFFSVSPDFIKHNQKRISYVPNGLAPKRLNSHHIDGIKEREKYHIKDDEVLCEIFGWSQVVKGVDIAVNAVKLLNEQGKPVKLAIVGGTSTPTSQMQQWVKENTECSGDEPYLIYLEPTEDVFSYHEAADILLSASRSEGFSYSILEMLSLGKRCVISDISGTKWAQKYETTFSFSSGNVECCANAICKAILYENHPNARVAEEVCSEYSIDNWAETIIEKLKLTALK